MSKSDVNGVQNKSCRSSRSRVFAYHLPWLRLGYVGAQAESYRCFPEAFARL